MLEEKPVIAPLCPQIPHRTSGIDPGPHCEKLVPDFMNCNTGNTSYFVIHTCKFLVG
jgi:hypothetical protein